MSDQVKRKVPAIRFKGFDSDWERDYLGNRVEFFSGLTYSPADVVKEIGTLVLRSSNVQDGEIVNADNVYVNSEVVNCKNVEIGDVVVVVRNGSRNLIGKNAMIKEKIENAVIGAFMTGISSQTPGFINALLNTRQFKSEVDKNLGATINQITTGSFRNMEFHFTNRSEAVKIGSFFKQLDTNLNFHQTKLDKLNTLKQAMLQKMFPQGDATEPEIRFKGFSRKWVKKRIDDIFEYERPDNYIVSSSEYCDKYLTPVLTANKAFVLGYTDEKKKYENSCIIFDDFTLDSKYVDFPFMVKSSALKILTVQDENSDDLYFSHYLLKQAKIEIMGHARHYISVVQPTQVTTTTLDEQLKIGNYFRKLDKLISLNRVQLDKIKQVKLAYLVDMFV